MAEYTIKAFPIDANLPAEVSKLGTEGWELLANVPPIAVYYLTRPSENLKQPTGGGIGNMHIDGSKVLILPPQS